MPKQQNTKKSGVRVYSTKLFAELCRGVPIDDGNQNDSDETDTHEDAERVQQRRRYEHFLLTREIQAAKTRESLEERLKTARLRRDTKFDKLTSTIEKGRSLVDSIDKFIKVTEDSSLQKKEQLYGDDDDSDSDSDSNPLVLPH